MNAILSVVGLSVCISVASVLLVALIDSAFSRGWKFSDTYDGPRWTLTKGFFGREIAWVFCEPSGKWRVTFRHEGKMKTHTVSELDSAILYVEDMTK